VGGAAPTRFAAKPLIATAKALTRAMRCDS